MLLIIIIITNLGYHDILLTFSILIHIFDFFKRDFSRHRVVLNTTLLSLLGARRIWQTRSFSNWNTIAGIRDYALPSLQVHNQTTTLPNPNPMNPTNKTLLEI